MTGSSPDNLQIRANNLALIFGTLATILAVVAVIVGLFQFYRLPGTTPSFDVEMQRLALQTLDSTSSNPVRTDTSAAESQTQALVQPSFPDASSTSMQLRFDPVPRGNAPDCIAVPPPSYRASQQHIEALNCGTDAKEISSVRSRSTTEERAETELPWQLAVLMKIGPGLRGGRNCTVREGAGRDSLGV
ncbi:hypothetical protein LTS10_006429 [Elasticomyces elasticus]|nr:hypothetical protein LTS10_006429 [Elasticomyces elasticus]